MPVPLLPFSDAELFNSVNLALPAWLLLLVAPRWRYTAPFVTATALGFAALYIATIVPQLASGGLDFSDLFSYEGVVKAFATRSTVLPAWLHFVAFDLWTARWEVEDAHKHGVSQLMMAPCILVTFLLGPTGLLLYHVVRAVVGRKTKTR